MSNANILVVEDRQPLADLYAGWLDVDHEVQTAYTGREAVSMLDDSIDVLLLDRRLPDISGDDVFEISTNRGLSCRVAMITAAELTFETATKGLDDYLLKPVSRTTLRKTVDRLLSQPESAATESAAELGQSPTDAILRRNGSPSTTPDPVSTSRDGVSAEHTDIDLEHTDVDLEHTDVDRDLADEDGRGTPTDDPGPSVDHIDMQRVEQEPLPPVVSELIDMYDERLGYRDSEFLLKWLHVVFRFFTLSSVDETYAEECRTVRTLASMYVMLIDDLGERHDDDITLAQAAKLPFPSESIDREIDGIDHDYMAVTEAVWEALAPRLQAAPRYDEVKALFRYDMRQVIQAIRYSALLNENPEIANMSEVRALGAHNMMMLAYADIDIAFSPTFDCAELGRVRSLLLELQQMARIGNWVTTWERELDEGDVSAGVFVIAVENGILSAEELRTAATDPDARDEIRSRIENAHVEEALIEQWQQRCDTLRSNPPEIASIDVDGLIGGMERVMAFHLASRGLK